MLLSDNEKNVDIVNPYFCWNFRAKFFVQYFFRYKVIKQREIYILKNEKYIEHNGSSNIEDIIKENFNKTGSVLSFSFDSCANDPNILIKTKKANCIGYSAFLAASIKNRLAVLGLDDKWEVSHEVGEIYFLNENINKYFTSKFFKDHDFVVVRNKKTKESIAVDPALYDYLRIDKIVLK
ncbi:hypothetical protein ACQWU4_07265 [Chryseobacterium sp. MIQD13]|uniref:hypothetical protein n=1 Tax=Chryseobacterium sp. MIQD13 TaxID=3422310 RepID=UPI003D272C42